LAEEKNREKEEEEEEKMSLNSIYYNI